METTSQRRATLDETGATFRYIAVTKYIEESGNRSERWRNNQSD
jgi:hypothetical protein